MQLLLEEARKDGSTVIVVQPPNKGAARDQTRLLQPKELLKVRARISKILSGAPTLPHNLMATFEAAGSGGSYLWVLKGFATALLGLFVGWLLFRPVARWSDTFIQTQYEEKPETTADKAKFLLLRALFVVLYSLMVFAAAMLAALVFDTGQAEVRQLVFELALAYALYRFLRYGVSKNLIAPEITQYRLFNLRDEEATRLHRDWWIASIAILTATAFTRFFVMIGFNSGNGAFTGNGKLTLLNSQLLYISVAAFVILSLSAFTIKNWKSMRHIIAPRDSDAWMFGLRAALARWVPVAVLTYGALAFAMFAYRVAILKSGAGSLIAGPFVIGFVSIAVFGLILIAIQAFYNRRIRRFSEHSAAAHEQVAQSEPNTADQGLDLDVGEEMIVSSEAPTFEYRPLFRELFEKAGLLFVVILAVGELARVWGVPLGTEGNPWAAFRDILLVAALCWVGFGAVRILIDHKIEEEGGVSEDVELGGEGGGAGASRLATLLPIIRYVLLTVIFSIAAIMILSKLDIEIGPIFAGAGVVGIAIGFGAQTLIRDMFSGAFFLMDDAFRRGEYVEIEGIKGVVEKISIRSFQLRHHLGALHTIPFGEIKQLTNYSRDWVMMKLPLRVTYDTDVEKVRKLVKKLGQELLEHPQVGDTFMQPLKSQGVYKMEDSAMIIRVKFMTKPGEQFVTRKVVYQSIQDLFAREGIKFAHKEVTVRLADDQNSEELNQQEKKAVTAAARSVIDAEEEVATHTSKKSEGSER